MARILIADADETTQFELDGFLSYLGHDVQLLDDVQWIPMALQKSHFDLLITDLVNQGRDGLNYIGRLRATQPHLGIIATSGDYDTCYRDLATAAHLGANQTLTKPFSADRLVQAVLDTLACCTETTRPSADHTQSHSDAI